MAENRSALIVAVSEYAEFSQLLAPLQDAEALAQVLGDPTIGGFAVKILPNKPSQEIKPKIEEFFADHAKGDLLLFYYSGHGIKRDGFFYFVTPDTRKDLLRSTSIEAQWLHQIVHHCNSRRLVLILDCCYSGAFPNQMKHGSGETVQIGDYFAEGEGRGRFVLTSSNAVQHAFERDRRSVFTNALVHGLKTGEADLNRDGVVSFDELYSYLYERAKKGLMPNQTPQKSAFRVEGELIITHNPHFVRQPSQDLRPWIRKDAAKNLGNLLKHSDIDEVAKAHATLLKMIAEDDSQEVRDVVAEILKIHNDWLADQMRTRQRKTADTLKLPVYFYDPFRDKSKGPEMMVIPEGYFLMGSPDNEMERLGNERRHKVEVKPFAIGKYAVTTGQFKRFVEATGYRTEAEKGGGIHFLAGNAWQQDATKNWKNTGLFGTHDQQVVVGVSWNDAIAYADWLSKQTGRQYRLPTEAEWEYACRAGTMTAYYFGSSINMDLANYWPNDIGFWKEISKGLLGIESFKNYPANSLGLHDMHGRVWEWTCSAYSESYDGSEQRCAPTSEQSRGRVLRGGSWRSKPQTLCAAYRFWQLPTHRTDDIGFRLARTI